MTGSLEVEVRAPPLPLTQIALFTCFSLEKRVPADVFESTFAVTAEIAPSQTDRSHTGSKCIFKVAEERHMHSLLAMAIINLNHPAHYLGIGPFQVSVGNLVIILSMFAIFLLAILIPFPDSHSEKGSGE